MWAIKRPSKIPSEYHMKVKCRPSREKVAKANHQKFSQLNKWILIMAKGHQEAIDGNTKEGPSNK